MGRGCLVPSLSLEACAASALPTAPLAPHFRRSSGASRTRLLAASGAAASLMRRRAHRGVFDRVRESIFRGRLDWRWLHATSSPPLRRVSDAATHHVGAAASLSRPIALRGVSRSCAREASLGGGSIGVDFVPRPRSPLRRGSDAAARHIGAATSLTRRRAHRGVVRSWATERLSETTRSALASCLALATPLARLGRGLQPCRRGRVPNASNRPSRRIRS